MLNQNKLSKCYQNIFKSNFDSSKFKEIIYIFFKKKEFSCIKMEDKYYGADLVSRVAKIKIMTTNK